ncbi:competence protein ComK [Oceanobacillus saliphilus]|uniref:competence protein ComK n=1 Tax=Oceanobacillus saliphilus TaxID=2925834 RepID=UPI00201E37F6|nr:competence protein ComK [Oceanobacillus saliphilus]
MNEILSDYLINEKTMALLPAYNAAYDTIAVEQGKRFFIQKTAIQLINQACIESNSTYEERRQSVINQTGFKRKIPIPINLGKNIFTFPTHATADFHCSWLFYHQLLQIRQNHLKTEPHTKSIITFLNGEKVSMDITSYILNKQMERTLECIFAFSSCSGKAVYGI